MKRIKGKRIIAMGLILGVAISLIACNGNRDLHLKGQEKSETKKLERNKEVIYEFTDSVIAVEGYDEKKTNIALSEFALRLFEKNMYIDEQGSTNVLISPTSVITALGMTSYGAKGNTLSQMEDMFGVKRGYLTQYNGLYLDNVFPEMKVANSIWFTNDARLTVKDEFLQFNEEFYGADIYKTAFNEATVDSINDWVEKKTNGMIKDILDEIPQDAVMYLINALAFEAEWENKYDSTQIWKDANFTTSDGEVQKVDLMHSEERVYLEDQDAKGFMKYYKDRNYAFAALLPYEGIVLEEYVKSLSGEKLQNILTNPKNVKVNAYLPQFTYEYDVEMSELLEEMGMIDAFDGTKADFTAMATSTRGNIFLNRVLHKTFIEVSPVGTKAGAATVVEVVDECAPFYDKMYEVRLDRPFIYMIIDTENHMPVFIGAVNSVE